MKRRFSTWAMLLVLVLGMSVGTLAASGNEWVQVQLNRLLRVTYNGEVQTFKDAKGNIVYPLSYNGTTYLPVRAVSGLLELPVDFDSASNTVILGTNEKQPTALVNRSHSATTEYSWIINDAAELTIAGDSANQEFKSGVQYDIWNGMASTGKSRVVNFETKGYQEVTFTAWTDVAADVKIFDQDYNVITSFKTKAGSMVSKTINIASATKIAFGADAEGADQFKNGSLKILDPTLK